MSNNKQSSVDFFAEKTFNLIELMKSRYVNQEEFLDGMLKAREQAKAMHKEESQKIFECGRNFQLTGESTFEQVYNEIFNTHENNN